METKMAYNIICTNNALKALIDAYVENQSKENLTNLVNEICLQNKINSEEIKKVAEEEISKKINELATKDFVRLEISNLRSEFKQDISNLRSEFKKDIFELRSEFKQDMSNIKIELNDNKHKLEKKLLYYFVGTCLVTIVSTNASSILSLLFKVLSFFK